MCYLIGNSHHCWFNKNSYYCKACVFLWLLIIWNYGAVRVKIEWIERFSCLQKHRCIHKRGNHFINTIFDRGPCIEFMAYGMVQILQYGQRLTRTFIWGERLRKCMRFRFLTMRLGLNVQIQKLKYKVKSLKHNSLE